MEHYGSTSEIEVESIHPPSTSASPLSVYSSSSSLEDMMKLLRGKNDSQRLAGLLLVTKFCDRNDQQTIVNVYRALGDTFLHRLLLSGMGRGNGGRDDDNREAYLRLAVTVLGVFARVPDIAVSREMEALLPLILEVMSNEYETSLVEECLEFLFLVSTAHQNGVMTLYESGGMKVLASQMPTLPDGSHTMELNMKLVQLIISKLPAEKVYVEHPGELSQIVVEISKQFALLHSGLKFEALHLLSAILSSRFSGALHAVLQSKPSDDWSTSIRVGIVAVLHNRVAPAQKLQALVLAESVMSIVGEEWLIGPATLPGPHSSFPADRCLVLVLESSRVEIAVVLNELAYLKYETSQNSPPDVETFLVKLRNLGVGYALVEKIIKLIAKYGDDEVCSSTSITRESTFSKIIRGLNETISGVLDYLQDAKDHKQRKGDDLLASVRIVGSYLAEAPQACREKVKELLGYMLSVEGEDEPRPFNSICFLLPLLCQITTRNDGCRIFASTGALGSVIGCLVCLIDESSSEVENDSTIFLACDTIMNFILKREQLHLHMDYANSLKLLQALPRWAESTVEPSVTMMTSSICTLVLDSTSEEALLSHPDFNSDDLIALSRLIKRSLVNCGQDLMPDNANSVADLHQIVTSGYSSWANRFPHIKEVVER